MGATANRTYLAFVQETQWGQLPATPEMQKFNFTGESFLYEVDSTTSNIIRNDRMVQDIIPTSAENTGGYETEFQAFNTGPDDLHMVAALWAAAWEGSGTQATAENCTITASTKTFDFTANSPGAMIVGQKFRISGATDADNNGIYTVATIENTDIYTTIEIPSSDETLPALSGVQPSEYIKNGLTQHSFSVERGHEDVAEYFLFKGCAVDEMMINVEAGEIVTTEFSFVGSEVEIAQTPFGNTYLPVVESSIMSASYNVKNLIVDGLPPESCKLQSLELTVANNLEGRQAVGVFGACEISEGEFAPTGTLTVYFTDTDSYQKFLGNQALSISFDMEDTEGNVYSISLPKVKLDEDTINAESKNSDVLEASNFVALADPVTGCAMQIDRIKAV